MAVIAFLAVGCGIDRGATGAGEAFETHDSAGITIHASALPAWDPGEGWRVAAEPSLQIGSVAGDGSPVLDQIVDGVRLSDGRIVLAERSTQHLLYFGPGGELLNEAGGRGDGPGEFRALGDIARFAADSVLALDLATARVTLLDPAGETAGSIPLIGDGSSRLIIGSVGRLPDGRFLTGGGWTTGAIDIDAGAGLYRPRTAALRFAADGTLEDTLVAYPMADIAVMNVQGRMLRGLTLFDRISRTAIRNDEVWIGTGERLDVRVYDPDGRLDRIIRGPTRDLAITPAEIEAQQRAQRGDSNDPEAIAFFDALFEAMPLPPAKPAFERLFVDPAGNIWLGPFVGEIESEAPWIVFAADGRWLGEVALPPAIEVIDIDNEFVIAIWRDSLDVEYVRLYPIAKSG